MPRTRTLIRSDPRETELLGEIGRAQSMTKKFYRYLCKRAGLEYGTFMAHKVDIENMRCGELWKFRDICEKEMKYV